MSRRCFGLRAGWLASVRCPPAPAGRKEGSPPESGQWHGIPQRRAGAG
ncbi:MAG: hypothetical protein MUC60_00965 [Oscillatoria sp. Prado101]|nr:hypothetical protein [Oscillatoria sp. Prado101]